MTYDNGPHDLGGGCYAYLVPDGHWGESNTGLVRGDGESLLVDTLYDLSHTEEMLAAYAPLTAGHPIRSLVNTHSDGDHWFGNQLVAGEGVQIIASEAAAATMTQRTVDEMIGLHERHDHIGDFIRPIAANFDMSGIVATPPTRTFSGRLDLDIGGREVRLIEVGPAHTDGDVLIHAPEAGVVWTGDIVFVGGAPLVWTGPISRCIAAVDQILALGARVVVPGHGPLTDAAGVRRVRDYLQYVATEATARFHAGLSVEEAASSIDMTPFSDLSEQERIAANVLNVYEELDPERPRADRLEQFSRIAAHGVGVDS